MKIISREEANAHYRHVLIQGSKGAAAGLAVGLTGVWAATRRFPGFRAMPLPFKAFLCTVVSAGTAVTVADRASLAFERRRYGGPEQEKVFLSSHADWKHKYREGKGADGRKLIGGAWAGSMAGSWYVINKNKHMTTVQKGVQARMIAQGITVVLLLVSAALASRPSDEDSRIEIVDPTDPTKRILINEKYPGESQWLSQIAAEEDRMRARGNDKNGHSTNGNLKPKPKKHEE